VAAVTDDEPEPALPGPGPPGAPPEQRVRFCRARDGTRLAFATSGAGRPLVKAANWLGHLEYDWETPVWRHWWTGLSRAHTLVRYDERGCGLTDWDVDRFTMEAYVDDLATVVDAAGLDRFDLLGVSQGGAVAVSYAAAHPERVDRLVIYGAYERGRAARALTAEQREDAELQVRLVRVGWGSDDLSFRRVFAMQFLPQGTYEQWEAFAELQRHTTSAENAARFLESFGAIDVGDVATQVTAPTLALHARDDRRVPLEQGRRLAAAIPHSRFVTLDSANHLLLDGEPAWARFLAEVEGFLAEGR
jgi:pimeloyl-ACP methyl ester carboxylesterase